MADDAKRVHWMTASRRHTCRECYAEIWPGMRFAHYVEILAPLNGRSTQIPCDFCEECGHLLEDSLTTTEGVR